MKLWERVVERRLRRDFSLSEINGFMPGRSIVEAIHLLRRLMELFRDRKKDLQIWRKPMIAPPRKYYGSA